MKPAPPVTITRISCFPSKISGRSASLGCCRSFAESVSGSATVGPVDRRCPGRPSHALVILRAVIVRHPIADDRIRLERAEGMAKADRHPKLVVLSGERSPRSTCRRSANPAQIDGHVGSLPGEATDQLPLCSGAIGSEFRGSCPASHSATGYPGRNSSPERVRRSCLAGKLPKNSRARPRSCGG